MLEIIKTALEDLTQNVVDHHGKQNASVQDKLLELLAEDGNLSAKNAALRLEISERQVQRLLKILKEEGKIKRTGSNRSGTWIISD